MDITDRLNHEQYIYKVIIIFMADVHTCCHPLSQLHRLPRESVNEVGSGNNQRLSQESVDGGGSESNHSLLREGIDEVGSGSKRSLPEMSHCSSFKSKAACNCGLTLADRDDPFHLKVSSAALIMFTFGIPTLL